MYSIETNYKGINFRSRLEAKWACFFDKLGWDWQYEPYDMNGWIPDFILIGKKKTTLVEVKPFERLDEFKEAINKILTAQTRSNNDRKEVLLLGTTPKYQASGMNFPMLGWMNDTEWCPNENDPCDNFDEALINNGPGGYGFFHSTMSYEDRITGEYQGDHHLSDPDPDIIMRMWSVATNTVQYRH